MYDRLFERRDFWFHSIFCCLYIAGSIMFVIGSVLLYSNFADFVNSARLYTLGSFAFVVTDAMDWFNNSLNNYSHPPSTEDSFTQKQHSSRMYCTNAVSFTSILGSIFYLIGSIFFLREVNLPRSSLQGFLVASVLIMLAQTVKVYRTICFSANNEGNKVFRADCFDDTDSSPLMATANRTVPLPSCKLLSAVMLDVFIFAGALCFLIGSYDGLNQTSSDVLADLFTVGSVAYLLAGMLTGYKHFCRPHSR